MVFRRLSFRIIILVIIAMLGLVGVVSLAGSRPVLAIGENPEFEIQGGLIWNDQNFSEFSGAPVALSFYPDTIIESIKITVETYTDIIEIKTPTEFTLSEGRLLTFFTANLNGYYTITAKVLHSGEEIEVDPLELDISVVDCFAPFANMSYEIMTWEGGLRLVNFSTRIDDYRHPEKNIKETAYSGIQDIVVFCDTKNRSIEDLGLGERVEAVDILKKDDLNFVYTKLGVSTVKHLNEYDIAFDTNYDGTYYVFASDGVANSRIEKLFTLDQSFLYPVTIDDFPMDALPYLQKAMDFIDSEGVYGDLVLKELEELMMEFVRFSLAGADEDTLTQAYMRFREVFTLVSQAPDAVFNINIVNKDLINFDIRLQNFNINAVPSLKCEINVCQILLTDYRKDNKLFQDITKAVSVRGANKVIAINYQVLKDGSLAEMSGEFKFDLAIPKTFKRAAVAVFDGTGYNSIDIQKGKEWLIFSVSENQGVYYLIVYDSELSIFSEYLWLFISLPVVLAILAAVSVLYLRKIKKAKAKTNDDEETAKVGTSEVKVVKTVPKNKKKGNKSKKK